MFKKTFISIYFLASRVIVVQLSSDKKKIVKEATVEIPPGIIENSKVIDEKGLSQILKNVWTKFHLKEKSVGLILPEFSTFTKLFKLPKLRVSELAEAVTWQAQEFLPTLPSEMITDWKIVEKSLAGFEILFIAVNRELLIGYVKASEMAGLFPLVVEIPSVGLARLTSEKGSGSFIVYTNFGETLLIISEKEKIFGTSVFYGASSEQIVKTSQRMLVHYKDVKVAKLLVGGNEMTEELSKKLGSALKLSSEWLQPQLVNLESKEIQQFLIPISQQFGETAEPMDPTSVNLLPAALVDRYRVAKLKLQIWSLTLTVTLFVWISFLITLGAYLFMRESTAQLKSSMKVSVNAQKRQEFVKEVEATNRISGKILAIKKSHVLPQKILNGIYSAKPSTISLVSYSLDLDKGEIDLTGISSSRESLLAFKQNLESTENFSSVAIPISSFEEETNLLFQMSFKYKPIYTVIPSQPVKKERVINDN